MMYDPIEFESWWLTYPRFNSKLSYSNLFGEYRIRLGEIPSIEMIRFLSSVDVKCNSFGEMIVSEEILQCLLNFEKTLNTTEEEIHD